MKTRTLCAVLLALEMARIEPAYGQTPAANNEIPKELTATVRAEVAEKYAHMLSDRYVYAEKGARIAAAVRARLKAGAYDQISSPQQFAAALAADARAVVDDRHLNVFFSDASGGGRGPMVIMRRGGHLTAQMLAESARANGGIAEVRMETSVTWR